MVILHASAHPRINKRKYLLSKTCCSNYISQKKEAHARAFLEEIHALNVYQIKILQILTFEHF